MRKEDGAGEGGRVEGDAGASFGGCVARSKKERGIRHSGIGRTVVGPVKDLLSECRAGDGKEKTGTCAGIGVASVQGRYGGRTGEGKVVGTVDGGGVADGS